MAASADSDEKQQLANIVATRQILRSSLEKSREVSMEIMEAEPRLEKSRLRLASLEAAVKELASKCELYGIRRLVDGALGPADSVLRIFEVVCDLQSSLMTPPSSDLLAYVTTIDRIEEAVQLLGDSCRLLILWLEDALHFLENRSHLTYTTGECDWYIANVQKCLHILGQLEATKQRFRIRGGLLMEALNNLENEFRRLLLIPENIPPISASTDDDEQVSISCPTSYPPVVRDKMDIIIERLAAANRLDRCLSVYIEVRSSIIKTVVQSLDVDYLGISLSEVDSLQIIEGSIHLWGKHLGFIVKYVLAAENRLCGETFQKFGSEIWQDCFAKIVLQSGFYYNFIEFGKMITRAKKEAIKLLKLLDIFSAINKLRLDFNTLFSANGKACFQIQAQTRELINSVINLACHIFWELSIQIESQRQIRPPLDGSAPRIIRFVTEFCNLLLEHERRSALVEILEIHQGWNNREFKEELVSNQVHYVIKELELNLEAWAKAYEDISLSHFFMMNSRWSMCKSIKGTKLGDLMGQEWLEGYEAQAEHNASAYLEESWETLPSFLAEDDLILFPGGRAVDHKLVESRLRNFNRAFDQIFRKQSSWVLSDKDFRLRAQQLIMQVIIPPYSNYLRKYVPSTVGDHEETNKFKSPQSLKNKIGSLFQPKLGKYDSTKCTDLAGKICDNPVTGHFLSSAAVAGTAGGHFPSSPAAA